MTPTKQPAINRPTSLIRRESGSFVPPVQQGAGPVAESLFVAPVVQPKLNISQPGDAAEQEAEAVAEKVVHQQALVSPPKPESSRISESPIAQRVSEEPEREEDDEEPVIMRKAMTTGSTAGGFTLQSQLDSSRGQGNPLPPHSRKQMEQSFGSDFSGVSLHTDNRAATLSRQLNAHAFTYGQDIYFGAGQFDTSSTGGQKLLAHELTHVVQQRSAVQRQIQRDTAPADPNALPVSTMQVTLSGLRFVPQRNVLYNEADLEGRKRRVMSIVLYRLLGDQFSPTINQRVYDLYTARGYFFTGQVDRAQASDPVADITLSTEVSNTLLTLIENDLHLRVVLSAEQRELLALGLSSHDAFQRLQNQLPAWYTQFIFDRDMAQQGDLIRAYNTSRLNTPADSVERGRDLSRIFNAIGPTALIIDLIREDFELGNLMLQRSESSTETERRVGISITYRSLWQLPTRSQERLTAAPSDSVVNEAMAVMLGAFIRTQRSLLERAIDSDEARAELVERFSRFYFGRVLSGSHSDEAIMRHPARANAPAWQSTLSSAPALRPPLFDAALETDHRFSMNLTFGDVFDAFVSYSYLWERIRLPEPRADGNPSANLDQLAGERPSLGEVYDVRMRRAHRYNAADIARIQERTGLPFGTGAHDLVHINNVLRLTGTVIRLGLERLTMPRSDKQIVFPEAGLYVIRCIAVPIVSDNAEVVHAPSVAYQPVLARDPDLMATSYVQDSARSQFQARIRLAEIQNLLGSPFGDMDREALQQEAAQLEEMLLEPGQLLERRRQQTNADMDRIRRRIDIRRQIQELGDQPGTDAQRQQLATLRVTLQELGGVGTTTYDDERLLRRLDRQLDQINDTLENRRNRTDEQQGGLQETLTATFVSDLGNSLELSLELYDHGVVDGQRNVFLSDLTTPSSGVGRGLVTHRSPAGEEAKVAAVRQALRDCLETSSDYGRGRVAFRVGGQIYTQRIEAGEGRLFSEAIENATTVMSIAAILAAPFTAGESLILLLPLGAVGALPSAYRIYTRADAGTFRWFSLETVMDVVNIVGGVIGLARAATPLRLVRMGQVLMVTGMAADGAGMLLMGAGLLQQLSALEGLPEGERAARMLEIMGMAFVQMGIQVGGMVAHARYGSATTPHGTGEPEPRGFHLDPDATQRPSTAPAPDATTHPPTSPAHDAPRQTMSGLGAPPSGSPPPPAHSTGAPEPARPLLDLLNRGIDRSQAPPARPTGQTTEIRSGQYGRETSNPQRAYALYIEALNAGAGREAAIYFDTTSGKYRVHVGNEGSVRGPYNQGNERWIPVVHYHPNPDNVTTYRLPAPADFNTLIRRAIIEGTNVREFVEFDLPGLGRGRTEFGIDMNHAEPYYVTMNLPDGSQRTVRFANDGAYHAYWGERTTYIDPSSPAYRQMIEDLHDYFQHLERDNFGSSKSSVTQPGSAQPQTMAGVSAPRSDVSLQTGSGSLTPMGVELIRHRFQRAVRGLTDAQIQERFHNQPNWLEAIVQSEIQSSWTGRNTPTNFLLAVNGGTRFADIAPRLSRAVQAGGTGHVVSDSVLSRPAAEFIQELVNSRDPVLEPAYNLCETNTDRAFRARWQEFKYSQRSGEMSGFFLGEVGNKRPDFVEVLLSQNEIHIYDATFAYEDPIHNFKSAFYRAVMERLINVQSVTSTDYRSPSKQTPVGP